MRQPSRGLRIPKGAPRKRRLTVRVRAYCRRRSESAFKKAERVRKSMPF